MPLGVSYAFSKERGLRIDTGDLGMNGGACFMHLVIFYCIRYLYVLGVII